MIRYLGINLFIFFLCFPFFSFAQCGFQYISNDTIFQDYIDFVYPRINSDEIITIGSRQERGVVNDSIFTAHVFQSFDNCGKSLIKRIYKYIANFNLRHELIPKHNTYTDEPVGNNAVAIKDDEFLLVDKAVDTLLKQFVMVLYKINQSGELKTYKSLVLTNQEANQTGIKNVLKLRDGKFLVILWGNISDYYFYYFDENLNFLLKKSLTLSRGIRSIKEIDNGEFVCTSIADANATFQFYRFDTSGNGEIKWIVTPYSIFGSAREILIENNKIYVTGGTGLFGLFLICEIDGTILKEFKYDTFYCQQNFCNAYVETDHSFIIGGYIKHCQSTDSIASEVAILKIDTNGTILWNKLYSFRNSLGTSGPLGKYTDYGGFIIAKTIDDGFITNGKSTYRTLKSGKLPHEDALLIKTGPLIVANSNKPNNKGNLKFELFENLIINNINITGQVDLIKNWVIYSLDGRMILHGNHWNAALDLENFISGLYYLQIIDRTNCQYFRKFVKN